MTNLKRSAAEKSRDAILRAVRQQLPIEDATARSTITLNRSVCSTLEPRTWAFVNGALPIGWTVVELHATTFQIEIVGRRA